MLLITVFFDRFLCVTHNNADSLYLCIWICTSALLSDLL